MPIARGFTPVTTFIKTFIRAARIRSQGWLKLFCVLSIFAGAPSTAESPTDEPVKGAMQALDNFMIAFNARDIDAWAATLNYPHVRFASGSVAVFENAAQFSDRKVFKGLASTGWDHSHWLERDVVLKSADKVHIATVFQRFSKDNVGIGVYESLYIVTRENGRWGIKARSSLAP